MTCRLVAVFDPRGGSVDEAGLRRALGEGDAEVRRDGPLTVAWTGTPPLRCSLEELPARRGPFVAAAFDPVRGRGLIARDHLGEQPLFWAVQGGRLHVAWEVAPLLAVLPTRPTPDLDRLATWLAGAAAGGTASLHHGVAALPSAHALLLDPAGWRLHRYWRAVPRPGLADADPETARDVLRTGIRRAVAERLPAAGRAGVLLSGGFDSSLVLGAAAAEARDRGLEAPRAYCVTFPDQPELDEERYRGPVLTQAGTPAVRVASGLQALTPVATAFAARFAVPLEFPSFALFRGAQERAAADGVATLLDGEGGDELFGCEPFLIADRLARGRALAAGRLTLALPGMTSPPTRRALRVVGARMVLPALLGPPALAALRRGLRRAEPAPSAPAWLRRSAAPGTVPPPWPRSGATPSRRRRPDPALVAADAWRSAGDGPRWLRHRRWLLTEGRDVFGVHDHLRRTAALTGAPGASPLLDRDLVELVLGLPPALAFDRRLDRALAREAARGLVAEAVRAREDKTFFDALVTRSLTGPDRAALAAGLDTPALRLAEVVDPAAVAALLQAGPTATGAARWTSQVWRLWAAETWLRSLED